MYMNFSRKAEIVLPKLQRMKDRLRLYIRPVCRVSRSWRSRNPRLHPRGTWGVNSRIVAIRPSCASRLTPIPLAPPRAKLGVCQRELQNKDRPRYESISQKQSRWCRPKADEVAKRMNLGFLYRFGYNYASTHVHPMASDGEADFTALIAPPDTVKLSDATAVRNSILVQGMLVQEALNVSRMRWRAIAYDFLDQIRVFLETGGPAVSCDVLQDWPGMAKL